MLNGEAKSPPTQAEFSNQSNRLCRVVCLNRNAFDFGPKHYARKAMYSFCLAHFFTHSHNSRSIKRMCVYTINTHLD